MNDDPLLFGTPAQPVEPDPRESAAQLYAELATGEGGGRRYPPELKAAMCREALARVRLGESVRQIAMLEHMPCYPLLWEWLWSDEWREQMDAAKVARLERYAEEIEEIAEDGTNDWVEREIERGGKVRTEIVFNKEHVQRSKLRMEARQWLMARLNRAKWGERTAIDLNADLKMSDEQAATKAAALLARMETLAAGMQMIKAGGDHSHQGDADA